MDKPWALRKVSLVSSCVIQGQDFSTGAVNVAVRTRMRDDGTRCALLLDLHLPKTPEGMPLTRTPEVTDVQFSMPEPLPEELLWGQDYMLVGATIAYNLDGTGFDPFWPLLTKETGFIRLCSDYHSIIAVAELFSGGMSAWSQAAKCLPMHVTMCVDKKMLAVQSLQLNEMCRDDGSATSVVHDTLHRADVSDMRVLCNLSTEEGLMASPPCQGFSNLGKGLGLDSWVAAAWESMFKTLRFAQRRFLVLENVVGLTKHRDFQEICAMLRWCGYVVVHQRICDATSLGCAARMRLVLVAWNNAEWKPGMHFLSMLPCDASPPPRPVTCHVAGSLWRSMPQHMLCNLLLDESEVTLLALRSHLPPWQRMSTRSVWDLRRVHEDSAMPSVTASYHTCTSMPEHHIHAKGLYVPLVETQYGFRRLSKWEVLHSMGMPISFCLPCDEPAAISLLGESFPPFHAMCALLLAAANRPDDKWDKAKVEVCFHEATAQLSPCRVQWTHMCEVRFGGWSRLVLREHADSELSSLEMRVVRMRLLAKRSSVLALLQRPVSVSLDPMHEKTFFEEDCTPDCMHAEVFRPGWGSAKFRIVIQDDDYDEEGLLREVAGFWNMEAMLTMLQRVLCARPWTFVADEVQHQQVSKRLVLLDSLPRKAVWLSSPCVASALMCLEGMQDQDAAILLNECYPPKRSTKLDDGDMVRIVSDGAGMVSDDARAVNPLRVWPPCQVAELDAFSDTAIDSSPTRGDVLPPTQWFRVQLPASPEKPSTKRRWPEGGLKGGCMPDRVLVEAAKYTVHVHLRKGWWLQVLDRPMVELCVEGLQGRTIRQERERLDLLCLDTTKTWISVVTPQGTMNATWTYKFPFSVRDDAVLVIHDAPHESVCWHVSDCRNKQIDTVTVRLQLDVGFASDTVIRDQKPVDAKAQSSESHAPQIMPDLTQLVAECLAHPRGTSAMLDCMQPPMPCGHRGSATAAVCYLHTRSQSIPAGLSCPKDAMARSGEEEAVRLDGMPACIVRSSGTSATSIPQTTPEPMSDPTQLGAACLVHPRGTSATSDCMQPFMSCVDHGNAAAAVCLQYGHFRSPTVAQFCPAETQADAYFLNATPETILDRAQPVAACMAHPRGTSAMSDCMQSPVPSGHHASVTAVCLLHTHSQSPMAGPPCPKDAKVYSSEVKAVCLDGMSACTVQSTRTSATCTSQMMPELMPDLSQLGAAYLLHPRGTSAVQDYLHHLMSCVDHGSAVAAVCLIHSHSPSLMAGLSCPAETQADVYFSTTEEPTLDLTQPVDASMVHPSGTNAMSDCMLPPVPCGEHSNAADAVCLLYTCQQSRTAGLSRPKDAKIQSSKVDAVCLGGTPACMVLSMGIDATRILDTAPASMPDLTQPAAVCMVNPCGISAMLEGMQSLMQCADRGSAADAVSLLYSHFQSLTASLSGLGETRIDVPCQTSMAFFGASLASASCKLPFSLPDASRDTESLQDCTMPCQSKAPMDVQSATANPAKTPELDVMCNTGSMLSSVACTRQRGGINNDHSPGQLLDVPIQVVLAEADDCIRRPESSVERRSEVTVASPQGCIASESAQNPKHERLSPLSRGWTIQQVTFFSFPGAWRCVPRTGQSLQHVMEHEWGLQQNDYILLANGKRVSPNTTLQAIPPGLPVRVTFRLRGGVAHAQKKLKELLLAKGVSEAEVQSRVQEVVGSIGDQSLQECFAGFDPWQALKSRCQGKLRLVKAAEQRPKAKKQGDETDPLQLRDPWREAIQMRQLRPDPAFFETRSGSPPMILQAIAQGASGIVVIDAKEAVAWAKSSEDISPDELTAIVLGPVDLVECNRPVKTLEFPCCDQNGARLLIKGTAIELGATPLKVKGEDQPLQMRVIDSRNVACELHGPEIDEWQEAKKAPVKFIRQIFGLGADDILHTWGRRAFRSNKQVQHIQEADSIFLMLRLKASMLEPMLKQAMPGIFVSPRTEDGVPHHDFKVVWLADKSFSDLRRLATSTNGCYGVVRSKSNGGIRVKCAEYTQLRQKLCPEWSPQDSTPYDAQLPLRYELHHVHPGAGKTELQALVNDTKWRALVMRQKRPMQWVVQADAPPERDTILTQHGCILVVPSFEGDRTPVKGKGKGKKGGKHVVIGGNAVPLQAAQMAAPHLAAPKDAPGQKDCNGPIQSAFLQLEEKFQERLNSMKQEAVSSHALLERDLKTMKAEFDDHVQHQRQEALAIQEKIAGVESALGSQLASFMSGLTSTLNQQKQDLSSQLQQGQDNLRHELTQEMRQQLSVVRKRTPSPSEGTGDDKRKRG